MGISVLDRIFRVITFVSLVILLFHPDAITILITLVVSVFLHEIGHYGVFAAYNIPARIIIVPFLGAATVFKKNLNRYSHFKISLIVLAGPIVNCVLIVIGLFMRATGSTAGDYVVELNAALVWFNLLPIRDYTDGGWFFRSLLESMDVVDRQMITMGTLILAGICSFVLLLNGRHLALIVPAVFVYLVLKQRQAVKSPSYNRRAMTEKQIIVLWTSYCTMLFSGFALSV